MGFTRLILRHKSFILLCICVYLLLWLNLGPSCPPTPPGDTFVSQASPSMNTSPSFFSSVQISVEFHFRISSRVCFAFESRFAPHRSRCTRSALHPPRLVRQSKSTLGDVWHRRSVGRGLSQPSSTNEFLGENLEESSTIARPSVHRVSKEDSSSRRPSQISFLLSRPAEHAFLTGRYSTVLRRHTEDCRTVRRILEEEEHRSIFHHTFRIETFLMGNDDGFFYPRNVSHFIWLYTTSKFLHCNQTLAKQMEEKYHLYQNVSQWNWTVAPMRDIADGLTFLEKHYWLAGGTLLGKWTSAIFVRSHWNCSQAGIVTVALFHSLRILTSVSMRKSTMSRFAIISWDIRPRISGER